MIAKTQHTKRMALSGGTGYASAQRETVVYDGRSVSESTLA